MLLADYRILIDENIAPAAAAFLKKIYKDAVYVPEAGLSGKDDNTLIEYALKENRIIFTQDKSFGNFYRRIAEEKIGIIFLRPGHVESEVTVSIVTALISKELSVELPFVIVAELQGDTVKVRIRTR